MARFQTKPISGARDFLPLDVLRRQYVIGVIERVYQSYGFEPLDTPVMERLDTLLGKYGEEGDQLIFRVAKRGAKLQRALAESPTEDDIADAGLRYDLTVPLARIVAEYSNQLPRYFKRYHIAPVFRADRPAKGRVSANSTSATWMSSAPPASWSKPRSSTPALRSCRSWGSAGATSPDSVCA